MDTYIIEFVVQSQVDEDGSKEIEFSDFVHVIQLNKSITEKNSDEQDTLDAFVALGGNVSLDVHCEGSFIK